MAIKTFTTGEVLTAADTNTYLNNGGLVWIAQGTFSGITAASPANVESVFNSTYSHYRIILKFKGTGNANMLWQFFTGTNTPDTNANYSGAGFSTNLGVLAALNEYNANRHYFGYQFGASVDETHIVADCMSPNLATETGTIFAMSGLNAAGGSAFAQQVHSYKNNTNQFTGFRFWPDANASTGSYWVYGYRIS